jgi:hypothetical protein
MVKIPAEINPSERVHTQSPKMITPMINGNAPQILAMVSSLPGGGICLMTN